MLTLKQLNKQAMSLLLFGLGTPEILLIFGAILLLFGGRKIPELMRGIGKGVREFNDAKQTVKDELEAGMKDRDSKEAK
jgi:sec-independent protein translocase protein TatA